MKSILGIGNAIVDVIIKLESDETLKELGFDKGSMTLINKEKSEYIKNNFEITEISSGGSAANTIRGLAKLNINSAFFGKVGNDDFGKFFINDTINSGTESFIKYGSLPTGNAITFVTPDSERTFATYLGSASELITEDINHLPFHNFEILYYEGYLIENIPFTENVIKQAKKYNLKIALDLSSYNIVEKNKDFLYKIIENIDILFANEAEAYAFCQKDPENAAKYIGKLCNTVIIKYGNKGSYIFDNNIYYIPPYEARVIDTTGAGDLYAAGFLYGYLKNYPPEISGKIGSFLASKVIEDFGTKITDNKWKEIFNFINNLTN